MTTTPLRQAVRSRRKGNIAILDGGMGTSLGLQGLTEQQAWTAAYRLDEPLIADSVLKTYQGFLRAGVDILTANTYNVSTDFVRDVIYADELFAGKIEDAHNNAHFRSDAATFARHSLTRNILLAKSAVDQHMANSPTDTPPPLLAASMGCYGTCVPGRAETANRETNNPMRTPGYGVDPETIENFHRDRIETALAVTQDIDGHSRPVVDILAFETVPDLIETRIIVSLLQQLESRLDEKRALDAWITFTCPDQHTVDNGDSFASCIEATLECDMITGVGINCTAPELVPALLTTADRVISSNGSEKLLVCYPNSGEQYLARELNTGETEHWRHTGTGEQSCFTDMALEWQRQGCAVIGGCCRITSEDIAALNQAFEHN